MKHIGRKVYHLVGGLGLLSLYFLLGRQNALFCYGVLIVAVLAIDITRLKVPVLNTFIFDRFGSFIRKNEANKLTGTAPYFLGIGLTLLLYQSDIAATAICFLAFGDVSATAVGERYGRTKISGDKSLEGTLGFVAAAVTVGLLLPVINIHPGHMVMLAGAVAAAGIELVPLPVNDNLVIPLVSGGVMELIARFAGSA